MSHVFISYNRINTNYVKKLEKRLISEGFQVWCDSHIKTGDEWWRVVKDKLSGSSAVIVIMTEPASNSPWVLRETAIADFLEKPIFPLLLGGEANAGGWSIYSFIHHTDVCGGALPVSTFYDDLARHVPRQKIAGGIRIDGIYICDTSSPLLREALRFYSNETVSTFLLGHDTPLTPSTGDDTDSQHYTADKKAIRFTTSNGRKMKGQFKDEQLSFRITYPNGQQDSRWYSFFPFED